MKKDTDTLIQEATTRIHNHIDWYAHYLEYGLTPKRLMDTYKYTGTMLYKSTPATSN